MPEDRSDLFRDIDRFLAGSRQENKETLLKTKLVKSLQDQLIGRVQGYRGEDRISPYTRLQRFNGAVRVSSTVLADSLVGLGDKSINYLHSPTKKDLILEGLMEHGIDASGLLSVGLHTDKRSEKEAKEFVDLEESLDPQERQFSVGTEYVYDEKSERYYKVVNVPRKVKDSRPKVFGFNQTRHLLDEVDGEDLGLMEEAFRALNGEMELAA